MSANPKLNRVARSVKSTRLTIEGLPETLEYDDLQDTEHYPGCLAFLGGRVGLSFKGLRQVITVKFCGSEYECLPGTFQPLAMSSAHQEGIRSLLWIWESWQYLMESEQSIDSIEDDIYSARFILNHYYRLFVEACGFINDNKALLRFEGASDPRLGLLLALETFDDDSEEWIKADCFSERTSFPQRIEQGQIFFQEDVGERIGLAYALVMGECNAIDLDRICELTNLSKAVAEQELVDLGLAVREPILEEGEGQEIAIELD